MPSDVAGSPLHVRFGALELPPVDYLYADNRKLHPTKWENCKFHSIPYEHRFVYV